MLILQVDQRKVLFIKREITKQFGYGECRLLIVISEFENYKLLNKCDNVGHIVCRYYNFTELACQLNEIEPDVAPTDSRMRTDQRLMEEGRWEESNAEKMRYVTLRITL